MRALDDLALLVARLCMAALFLPSGVSKAGNLAGFSGFLAGKGLPYPEVLAAITAAVEIGGPVLLILGVLPRITALVLIGFVIAATATAHLFWQYPDAAARSAQQIAFFKNVGLVGGLLFYFASGPGAFAIGGRDTR